MFKYKVIKKAISYDLANFVFNYFKLKRETCKYLIDNKVSLKGYNRMIPFIDMFDTKIFGTWTDEQVPGTFSCYSDSVMETLLIKLIPVMRKETGLDLLPTYSYARLYKKGDELKRHKDRASCEISTTLHLGGEPWPLFISETKEEKTKGIKVILDVGDMLVYSGCELEHWREPFEEDVCGQVFLHYNHVNGPFAEKNRFDKRPMLGVPFELQKDM